MKPKRIAALFVVSLFAIALTIQLHRAPEPSYQGKTLTQWLKKCEEDTTIQALNEEAVRSIGTKGIPTLLKLLQTGYIPGASTLQSSVEHLGWKNSHFFDVTYKPRLAAIGFMILGQTAKSATPKLIELARTSHSAVTQTYALWSLEMIKTDRQILLPLLVESLTNSNPETAGYAMERLSVLDPELAKKAGMSSLLNWTNNVKPAK